MIKIDFTGLSIGKPVGVILIMLFVTTLTLSQLVFSNEVSDPDTQPDKQLVVDIERQIAKLVEEDKFSGAVLVAKNGKPIIKKAYGLASKSYNVSNVINTKFNIASMGKMFTGVAIAQLVEKGKLSFDDPVTKYLSSDWIKPEIGNKIQIKHLLTHTSGLGTYFKALYGQTEISSFRGINDYKTLISKEVPAFEPGTKWSYSNTGMHLLGVVIEKVTGESYFDYIHQHIYVPAGMSNTGAFDKDIPIPNRASGYKRINGEWRSVLFTRVLKGGPSGGGFSTIEDLLKFDIALRSNKLLSSAYTDIVLTPKLEVNSPSYGYGFFLSENNAGRIASHGGDGSGMSAKFNTYLDSGYTVIVLSNYNRPAAKLVTDVIHQRIISQKLLQ